jgi:4-carboxymuconolactone decarboxylase
MERGEEVSSAAEQSRDVNAVASDVREHWDEFYAHSRVDEMWARPGLTPRNRSLVTVAALAALNCPLELETQMRDALANDITIRTLCEVIVQASGYAGTALAREAIAVLDHVSEGAEPSQWSDAETSPVPPDNSDRGDLQARTRAILDVLLPERIGMPPAPSYEFAPDWRIWMTECCFGYLWDRPYLTLQERSRVTMAVLTVTGQHVLLRSHMGVACNLGIPYAEIGEQIMHLAIYGGYSAAVVAMQIAEEVISEAQGRPPITLEIGRPRSA